MVIVAASATALVPSKDTADAVTKSPVTEKFLAFSNAVAVPALPSKDPVKVVAVIAPETFTSSSSVCPSTSIPPVNVESPFTLRLLKLGFPVRPEPSP